MQFLIQIPLTGIQQFSNTCHITKFRTTTNINYHTSIVYIHMYKTIHIMYICMYIYMNIPSDSESLSLDSFLCFCFALEKVTESNSMSITNHIRTLIATIIMWIHRYTSYVCYISFNLELMKSKWIFKAGSVACTQLLCKIIKWIARGDIKMKIDVHWSSFDNEL